jgi:hypothetical protein
MSLTPYPISSQTGFRFSFESIGPSGTVNKLILYDRVSEELNLYNLALVDSYDDGSLDDLSVSDNQDMPRILATVIYTMHLFFMEHPMATVIFLGSTPARTRLYRVAISQNLALFEETFLVKGLLKGEPELYQPNRPYEAFTVRLKTN